MDKKMTALIGFAAGVAVGMNWPKISKEIKPILNSLGIKTGEAYNGIVKFAAEKKESIEDMIAASKIKKKKNNSQAKKAVSKTKKKIAKIVTETA